ADSRSPEYAGLSLADGLADEREGTAARYALRPLPLYGRRTHLGVGCARRTGRDEPRQAPRADALGSWPHGACQERRWWKDLERRSPHWTPWARCPRFRIRPASLANALRG